ncbi:MAG: tetratricopeptide repeat protein [Bryobacteraceae bacterium]
MSAFAAWCLFAALAQAPPSDYQTALAHVQAGRFGPAIPVLERLVKESPDDLKIRNLLGIALSAGGRRQEANAHFKAALALNPKFYPALKNLAVNELSLGELESARSHFDEVLKAAPGDPVVHLGLGEIEFARKNYARASGHYERSGALAFQEPGAILNLASAYAELKQPVKAAAILEKVPADVTAATQFAAGILLARIEEYAAAARRFERAIDGGYPDAYQAGFNLTLAHVRSANYAAAIRIAEELLARGHRKAELYNLVSQGYEKAGKTKEAYDALRAATEIDPKDETNYLDLIALCLEHQNHELALEIAGVSLRNSPGSHRLHLQRGIVMAVKGEFEEAEKEFRSSTRLSPQAGLAYAALGLVLLQTARHEEAVTLLRERTTKNPGDALALWYLAEAINRAGAEPGGEPEAEAFRAVQRSVEVNPKIPQSRTLLGKMLLKRGELDTAARHLDVALQLDPEDLSATYQLAQVLRKKGDTERAKELFAKVSKAKAEDRDQFMKRGLLRIVREGAQ